MKLTRIVFLILLLTWCTGCDDPPKPKPQDIAGVYDGAFGDLTQTVEMRENGTYHESITRNGKEIISQDGTWKILGLTDLQFSNIYSVMRDGIVVSEPVLDNPFPAVWVDLPHEKRIAFRIQYNYVLDRH